MALREDNSQRSKPPRRKGNRGQRNKREAHDSDGAVVESQALEASLKQRGCIPDQGENEKHRQAVLSSLEKILCQWAATVQSHQPTSENRWQRPRVTLITFGSYRLRAHRPESDLDVLALSPPSCSRGDFFTSLVDVLQNDPAVEEVHSIPSAYTPVIKLQIDGIQVDMLFAKVADATKLLQFQQRSPSPLLSDPATPGAIEARREYQVDDTDLIGMDEAGLRSLNGVRVTQNILEMVHSNSENFKITLSAVKEWAIARGVYSNVLGFLGGVNFAILVAWVCKRHPTQRPSTLLRIFFRTFATWKWPAPVVLSPVQSEPPNGVPSMPIWDPQTNPRDARQLMPILTPAYPTMNSSYNVGVPQLRRMKEEMIRAALVLERGEGNWREIYQKTDFFQRHSNFLQVSIRAKNTDDFAPWQRFCESRLRLLITSLETPEVSAWPFAKLFRKRYTKFGLARTNARRTDDSCQQESFFLIGLRFAPGVESVNLRYSTTDFLHRVNSWEDRTEGMDLGIAHVLSADLPDIVLDYCRSEEDMFPPVPATCAKPLIPDSDGTENETRLTPKLARSTLDDSDICIAASPAKRAKNRP